MTAHRICVQCRGSMAPEDTCAKPGSPFVWSDRKTRFVCRDCGHTVTLTAPSSILFGGITGLAGLAVLGWGLSCLESLKYLLGAGPGGIALGGGTAVVVLMLWVGAMVAARSALAGFMVLRKYPLASPGKGLGRLAATLGVSALPVALCVGFGFYDHYVRDLDEFSLVVLPLIFSPLLLGTKLGLSFLGLFLGCALWMGLLVAAIFLF